LGFSSAPDPVRALTEDLVLAVREIPLGKPTDYTDTYTPSLLHTINRSDARGVIGVTEPLPFIGEDVWWGYELSWLDAGGKPLVAAVQINVPCNSICIVESKSLKLYLNSFAQTRFNNRVEVQNTLNSDLAIAFRSPVIVQVLELTQLPAITEQLPGVCLDGLDVQIDNYEVAAELLDLEEGEERRVKETLHTNLFRSLCPVTGQPDFASVFVQYLGRPILRTSLLRYLVSYRCHQAFHEATIEQIFVDLSRVCQPEQLSVTGRFLRRGGIDINPFRSNTDPSAPGLRLARQ
jgi:7-cyano-7-deazaguanine reductase